MKIIAREEKVRTGEKILLFSPTIDDAQQLADHANKVFAETKFLSVGPEDGRKTAEHEIKWIESVDKAERSLIITGKINNQIVAIGNLSAKSNQRFQHRCSLGISIQKDFWGKGIGTIIMKLLLDYAKKLDFEIAELSVVKDNVAAYHLYKKLGFEEYGIFKKALRYQDGTYADLIYMIKEL